MMSLNENKALPAERPVERHEGMRVLFLIGRCPKQGVGGGATTALNFIGLLREPPIEAQVDVEALRRRPPLLPHRLQQLLALIRSLPSSLSSKTLFDLTPNIMRRIVTRVREVPYDLIVIDGGQLFVLADQLPRRTTFLGLAHNVESALYREQTKSLRGCPGVRQVFSYDLSKLERAERRGLRAVHNVVCISTEDEAALVRLEPTIRTLSLPTSFSYPPSRRKRRHPIRRPLKLGFLAKYSWWPNVEAVEWLVQRVLPSLPVGAVTLLLVGPGGERFAQRDPSIVVRGFVPDLAEFWNESDIVVCPMITGSGINIKFIEAIYNGCPVLATSFTKRGLPEFSDPAVVYLDTPEEWIEFLRSDAAEQLARRRPHGRTSEMFSRPANSKALATFLSNIEMPVRGPADRA